MERRGRSRQRDLLRVHFSNGAAGSACLQARLTPAGLVISGRNFFCTTHHRADVAEQSLIAAVTKPSTNIGRLLSFIQRGWTAREARRLALMTIEYHYKQRGRDEQLSVRKGYRGAPANSRRAGKQWLGRSLLNFSRICSQRNPSLCKTR